MKRNGEAKAALKRTQSRRFADGKPLRTARLRLECADSSALSGEGGFNVLPCILPAGPFGI
jgi:hypothetical protein